MSKSKKMVNVANAKNLACRTCDILNYMVTPSDHQCTNDGGHFISQSIKSRCVCRDPYNGVLLC